MDTFSLDLEERTITGKTVRNLRAEGKTPVVIYGQGAEPKMAQVDTRIFTKLYKQAGESSVITLSVGSEKDVPSLIHEVIFNPVTGVIQHADLLRIDLKKEISATVHLKQIGTAPAVKEFGGVVVTSRDYVKIRCLPTKLVHEIEVDLSTLSNLGDSIHIKDLVVPEGVTIEDDGEIGVVLIAAPRKEESAAPITGTAAPIEGAAAPVEASAPAGEAKVEEKKEE